MATRILHTNCDEVIRLAATSLSRLLSGSRWLFLISIEGLLELLTCLEDLYLVFSLLFASRGRKNQKTRIHIVIIVGLRWTTISNPIYIVMTCREILGKMSQRLYIDQISKSVVTSWIEAHPDFLLEEDGDSFHGPGNSNIGWMWKESIGLKFYFNCQSSPVLENCW